MIAYTYVKTFSIILWLTLSFFWLTNVYAQISLPPIVVTASRLPQPSTEIGREIEIIEAEEIRQLPIHSVDELLEYFSSIDVRNRGISGIQSDFSLRGSSFEQVLFLINGMPINDPQTGHHHGDIPITLNEIDRIEVVLGGASALYGHGGFGGVINIITKKQTKPKIKVKYAHGEYDYNLEKIGLTTPTWQDNQLSLNWERPIE
ncbi:Vitamin B12 transporter BtuB [Candidatus Methanoperedenaceae archaeon GB37]|nr:Vitamin B12 transporter BtuB [Candidatus Methanoperedenaceae archaeon GB37]